nr:anti-sigma factor antagonist [candidate division Zixibacteria bacterium]
MKKVFNYPSCLESESRMYQDVKGTLSLAGLPKTLLYKIILAISEGFTNALIHGNKYNREKSIQISITINKRLVIADIMDEGAGNIEILRSRKAPDLFQEGGRGVDLMESLADEIRFEKGQNDSGLKISMIFDRSKYISDDYSLSDMEDKMEFRKKDAGSTTVISMSGRLDLSNGGKLKEEIKNLLTSGKISIHLNLGEVEFVNSSGLGALVSMMKEIRIHRGRLTLSNLADYVQEIFDITQLSHIFEIYNSEEEALKSYSEITV